MIFLPFSVNGGDFQEIHKKKTAIVEKILGKYCPYFMSPYIPGSGSGMFHFRGYPVVM